MIYRKTPPQPVRLLLRVVAVAGAGAMAGAVACSSSGMVEPGVVPGDDGGPDARKDSGFMGATDGGGEPDGFMGFLSPDSGFMGATDGGGSDVLLGVAPFSDGGVCEDGCGVVGNPDATADVITGVIAHPDASADE